MLFILLLSLVTADLTNYKSGLEHDFIVDVRKNVGNFLEERPSANSFHISELKNFEKLRTLKCLKAKIGVQGWEKGEEAETEKTVQTLKDLGFENVKDLGVFSGGKKGFNADSSTDENALPECVEKRIRDEPKDSEEKDFDEKKKDFLESKMDSEEDLIKFYQLIKQEMKDKKEKSFSSSSVEEENLDLERFFDFFLENSSEDSDEGEEFDFGALKENIFGKIKEHVSEFSEKNLKETHDVFKAWISGEKTMDEVREYLGKEKKDGKDRSRGEGKDMSRGEGKHRSRGEGKDRSQGEGKGMSRGEGKDRSRGEGKDMSRGGGKDRSRGEGKDMSRGGEHHSGEGKDRSRGDGKRHSGEGKDRSRGEGKDMSRGEGKHHSGEGKDRSRGEGRPHSRGEGRQHSRGRGKDSGSRSDSSSSEEDESYNEDSDFFPDWPESKGEKRHHDEHSLSHSEEDAEMSGEDFRHMEGRDSSGRKGGRGRGRGGRGGRGGHKNGEKDKGKNGKGKASKGYSKNSSEEMEYDARGFNLYQSDNERHHKHHHHSKDDKKKYGFIAMIGGSVIGFCAIVACLYCFCRSRKAKVISTDQKIGEDSYSEEYEEVCEVKVHFEDKKDVVADIVTKDDGTTNTTLCKLSGTTNGLGGENGSSFLVE